MGLLWVACLSLCCLEVLPPVNELALDLKPVRSISEGFAVSGPSFLPEVCLKGVVHFESVLVLGVPAFVAVCSIEKKKKKRKT